MFSISWWDSTELRVGTGGMLEAVRAVQVG